MWGARFRWLVSASRPSAAVAAGGLAEARSFWELARVGSFRLLVLRQKQSRLGPEAPGDVSPCLWWGMSAARSCDWNGLFFLR